jgi:hypothetical protein
MLARYALSVCVPRQQALVQQVVAREVAPQGFVIA